MGEDLPAPYRNVKLSFPFPVLRHPYTPFPLKEVRLS